VELSGETRVFRELGINVVVMTYEPVETNREFVDKNDAGFVILTDRDSRYFRKLGIFNDEVSPDHRFYGIPHPGIMLVDPDGRIVEKFAEENYRERPVLEDVIEAARALSANAPGQTR